MKYTLTKHQAEICMSCILNEIQAGATQDLPVMFGRMSLTVVITWLCFL